MTSLETLRVGIIGAGGIAQNHHIPSYLACENVEVVAACDVSDAALESVKDRYGVEALLHDYQELIALDGLDIVSVCTSNDLHYPVVMSAIEQGLDIYCEKPMALNHAEAIEMHDAAVKAGIKTGVNFSHRRTPGAMLAKEIIDTGALGQITYISAVYSAGRKGYAEGQGSWRNMVDKAGFGGLGDMGSHMLDMMLWWFGCGVDGVASQMCTYVPERISRYTGEPMKVTTEDQGTVLLSYDNGAMGYLLGGYIFTGRGYDQRVEVYGSEGGLMYDQKRPYELDVCLPDEILSPYHVLRDGGTSQAPYTTILVPERLQGALDLERPPRRTVLMDWIDAYRSGGPIESLPTFSEGLRVQEILEGVRRASGSRCWISLPL